MASESKSRDRAAVADFPELEAEDEFAPYLPGHLRRSAVIETFAFLAAGLLASAMFSDGTRFLDMALHPFWIVVLLVTVQYGQREAIFAALASTAFLLVGNLPDQKLTETTYDYTSRILFQPLLWVVAALVLGSIRSRQLRARQELVDRLKKSAEAVNASLATFGMLKKTKENLEFRLAQERRSLLTVYDMARAVYAANDQTLMPNIERLVRTALAPAKFSLFRVEKNGLVLAQAFGWMSDDSYPASYDAKAALVRELLEERRTLSVVHADDEALLRGHGILARAIRTPESGRVLGVLKIEEMDFRAFTIDAHETFEIVCDWIALACAQTGGALRPISAREAFHVVADRER